MELIGTLWSNGHSRTKRDWSDIGTAISTVKGNRNMKDEGEVSDLESILK